tara:strand:- start:1169 stop:1540 length:372 start_codon:yes stop_codon:yes gene_type:complete
MEDLIMGYFFYMSNCSSCKRILNELSLPNDVDLIDIKKEPLTPLQLEELYQLIGSYETLINKRAQLFKKQNIDPQNLSESIAKDLLLDHYTFLKRPVLVYREKIFVGNRKSEVAAAKKWFNEY